MTIPPEIKYFLCGDEKALHTYWGRMYRRVTILSGSILVMLVASMPLAIIDIYNLYFSIGMLSAQGITLLISSRFYSWHLDEYYAQGGFYDTESRINRRAQLDLLELGPDGELPPSGLDGVAHIKLPNNRELGEYADSLTTGVDGHQEDRHNNE